ncbi:UNVERIFIED_ORG: bifunctional DNA-binding transcriptional regulator/antitoxin component of YhaV-PrlF toxin-antitoxin module [Rhizobium aethiopicum]
MTIPQSVRDMLGIAPGSKVDFHCAPDGSVVLTRADKKRPASRFEKLRGHAGKGLHTCHHGFDARRKGTFERAGWSGASMTNEIGGSRSGVITSGNRPGASGRYTLSGYRLDLTDASGKTESMSIFEPDKASDGLLVINGSNDLKDDGE